MMLWTMCWRCRAERVRPRAWDRPRELDMAFGREFRDKPTIANQPMIDYHDRRFAPVSNSANGEVSPEVIFHYHQTGRIVTCSYAGGRIVSGQLIALVDDQGRLDMRYHQVNDHGELMTGSCRSVPEVMPNGKVRLHETWQWTSGDGSSGSSVLEEM